MPIDTSFSIASRSLVRDVFVESGFYKGATVLAAVFAGFREIHSIEVDEDLFLGGAATFSGCPGVKLHLGSSPDVLPKILDPEKKTTIYLDGHFCGIPGQVWDPKYGQCPVLEELKAIGRIEWREWPIVVIDDSHLFCRPWPKHIEDRFTPAQWPLTAEVKGLLPGYEFVETEYMMYCFPR